MLGYQRGRNNAICSVLLAGLAIGPAFADPTFEQLTAGHNACAPHKTREPPGPHPLAAIMMHPYESGWEHCDAIEGAYIKAKRALDQADEAKNPDLKATRELSKALQNIQP